jgi:hypothetical protein
MGLKKEGPLPWFGVIQFAKFGLILAPWSGQHIQQKILFSAFSLSRYLTFSKGGQIGGTLGARVPWSGYMTGPGSVSADLYSRRLRVTNKKIWRKIKFFFFFFFFFFEEEKSDFFRRNWYKFDLINFSLLWSNIFDHI